MLILDDFKLLASLHVVLCYQPYTLVDDYAIYLVKVVYLCLVHGILEQQE